VRVCAREAPIVRTPEVAVTEGRVFIKALRNIRAGEELNYDYGLILDEPYTQKIKAEYPCWCGAKSCRGTLLAPKDKPKKKAKKRKH
jgi:SET domain-containing protein